MNTLDSSSGHLDLAPGLRPQLGSFANKKVNTRSDSGRAARGSLEVFGGAPRLLQAGVYGGPVNDNVHDEAPGGNILFSSGTADARVGVGAESPPWTGVETPIASPAPAPVQRATPIPVKSMPAFPHSNLKLDAIEKSLSERALAVEELTSRMTTSARPSRSNSRSSRNEVRHYMVLYHTIFFILPFCQPLSYRVQMDMASKKYVLLLQTVDYATKLMMLSSESRRRYQSRSDHNFERILKFHVNLLMVLNSPSTQTCQDFVLYKTIFILPFCEPLSNRVQLRMVSEISAVINSRVCNKMDDVIEGKSE